MRGEIDQSLLHRLRKLIGRECTYLGKVCLVIEVLSDEGVLVLECREAVPPIQKDQYGQANWRANDLVQVPVFGGAGGELSEEIMDLLAAMQTSERKAQAAPA